MSSQDRPPFRFKHFSISDSLSPMKVGVDSIMLGAWAPIENCKHILDIGTGSGLLALMMAQRNPSASIVGIEINENAYVEAKSNYAKSPWGHRLVAVKADVRTYFQQPMPKFDGIICNPPYFGLGPAGTNTGRQQARQSVSLNTADLLDVCESVITLNGCICMVLPTDQINKLTLLSEQVKLFVQQILTIYPQRSHISKRTIVCLGRKRSSVKQETLRVESPNFFELTKNFYLDKNQ